MKGFHKVSKRESVEIFELNSVEDYLNFCTESIQELEVDQANVLRGFTALLALNHLPDWLLYKLTTTEREILDLRCHRPGKKLRCDFENRNTDLTLVRSLANGFKHLKPQDPTGKIKGYGKGRFGIGHYGTPYLLIDKGEHLEDQERYTTCLELCQSVLDWWQKQLSVLSNP
jgi:hypothetical protein